jgi:hypothetical protein
LCLKAVKCSGLVNESDKCGDSLDSPPHYL